MGTDLKLSSEIKVCPWLNYWDIGTVLNFEKNILGGSENTI